ncbi:MAG TPA: hypothetical protein DCE56_44035 [Cyanobacteria bacterium UBA8553]|nr:hypothetical protein [Cyanobacteria bacterium UBA8553]HAJ62559.1 hypothetical protein [Cyanobacteria bacterium UBA8543]
MARAVEQIEQDLETLEKAIALLGTEFHIIYSQYLKLLGQAVRQQLILTSYQICTHGYPESFLRLSFNQRQKLQQTLRQLGEQAQEQLLSHLNPPEKLTETEATDETKPTAEPLPVTSEPDQSHQEELPETLEMAGESETPAQSSQTAEITKTASSKAEELEQWQEEIEEAIAKTLQTISMETNLLLQQNGIIPGKLPAAVLEAAAKADASGETTAGSPNLLNLLMETQNEDEEEDSTIMRIVAINLRLSEIEFADPALSASRNQIRNLLAKGNKLHREYHKKQRERSVAEAEAAWRLSWSED